MAPTSEPRSAAPLDGPGAGAGTAEPADPAAPVAPLAAPAAGAGALAAAAPPAPPAGAPLAAPAPAPAPAAGVAPPGFWGPAAMTALRKAAAKMRATAMFFISIVVEWVW